MFVALLVGYAVASVLVTVAFATFLGRTRERVVASLAVRDAQRENTTQYEDYEQRAA